MSTASPPTNQTTWPDPPIVTIYRPPAQTLEVDERLYDRLAKVCNEHDLIKAR